MSMTYTKNYEPTSNIEKDNFIGSDFSHIKYGFKLLKEIRIDKY